jgi:hypothetical protein
LWIKQNELKCKKEIGDYNKRAGRYFLFKIFVKKYALSVKEKETITVSLGRNGKE